MEEIKITYIDDRFDLELSKYLDNLKIDNYDISTSFIKFELTADYKTLLKNEKVQEANIIFIDSKLFEDSTVEEKFTGEEFKMILKKFLPYIEVIVISQNEIEDDYTTIKKFNSSVISNSSYKSGLEYYTKLLDDIIKTSIQNIIEFRTIVKKIKNSNVYETTLIDKLTNTLSGQNEYDELSSSDLDKIINLFEEIRGQYE